MTIRAKDNSKALAAFTDAKAEIDDMIARISALSGDHFGVDPGQVNWGHVGTVALYLSKLREITDAAFKEGEYAA